MKDKTASAFGTPRFNHYKIAPQIVNLNFIEMFLHNALLQIGFAPSEWITVIDLEVPKTINSLFVDEIRCILLFCSQYNMINKVLGRRVKHIAEEENMIEADQYGSCNHHKAICAFLNKVILNDIFCQQQIAGALAIVHARGFYDCISHTFAIIVLIRFGLCWLYARVIFEVLQTAKRCMKTDFGVSEPAY